MVEIQENVLMKNYTTFRIGGPAKFFVEAGNEEELIEALNYAKNNKLPFFILGGGSNLLVSDKGFDGLVIKVNSRQFTIHGDELGASAGVPLALVVNKSAENNLTGMEWAAGIPGTVGGAVRGNARAYGKNTGTVIESVRMLDVNNMEISNFSNAQCEFSYWGSVFKKNSNLIILSVRFKLQSGNKKESQSKIKEIIARRIAGQPKVMASAGSFFLNPVVTDEKLRAEFQKDTGKVPKDEKLPAGWLIGQTELRGKKIGGAMLSEEHANFIVNTGNATAEDIIMLVSIIKQQVRNKFGIELVEETQYLGFN
jgi:UDP-N-acetylmuramate dehydrogenase